MTLKVRALSPGYFLHLRRAGEVFEIPEGTSLGRWMVPLTEPAENGAVKRRARKSKHQGGRSHRSKSGLVEPNKD